MWKTGDKTLSSTSIEKMDMYLKKPNLACTYLVALWEHNIHLLNTHSLLRKKILFQRSQKSIFVYKVYKVCCSSDKNTITASSRQEEDKQRDSSFLHALLSFHPFCISSSTARAHTHTQHARGWGWEPSADKSEQVCCGNRGTTPRLKATPPSQTWADCLWDPHVPDATILSSAMPYHIKKLPPGCAQLPVLPPASVFGGGGGRASVLRR